MTKGKRLLFWVLLLAGTLGLLEAAASVLYYFHLTEQEREAVELTIGLRAVSSNLVLRYIPHPYFNFVSNPDFRFTNGYRPHNSMGLRGEPCCAKEKKPGQIRIVAIGGSTTYGVYFTYERNVWPALLQKKLTDQFQPVVEVINAGVPFYTSYELIGLAAMRVPEFSPDLILIHTGLNDAFTVGFSDEGGPDNTFFRHAWSYKLPPDRLKAGMRASYIIRLLGLRLTSSEGFLPGDMAGAIQHAPPADAEVLRNAQTATGKYFRRNLQTLVALFRNMGATPVLINEPLNPLQETGQTVYLSEVVKAVIRNNGILKEVADRNGLVYVDLYSKMQDPAFFMDAAHETQAGMEIKASTIATQITPLVKDVLKTKSKHPTPQ